MAMYKLGVVDLVFQTFTTKFNSDDMLITIRYLPAVSQWIVSVKNLSTSETLCDGTALVLGVPCLQESAYGFVLFIEDSSGYDVDPCLAEDFGTRLTLWMADDDEELLRAFLPA